MGPTGGAGGSGARHGGPPRPGFGADWPQHAPWSQHAWSQHARLSAAGRGGVGRLAPFGRKESVPDGCIGEDGGRLGRGRRGCWSQGGHGRSCRVGARRSWLGIWVGPSAGDCIDETGNGGPQGMPWGSRGPGKAESGGPQGVALGSRGVDSGGRSPRLRGWWKRTPSLTLVAYAFSLRYVKPRNPLTQAFRFSFDPGPWSPPGSQGWMKRTPSPRCVAYVFSLRYLKSCGPLA